MIFRDRTDAGRKLAAALAGYAHKRPVVLALPRGGVVVAAEIAHALQAPLDLILVRKIGVPAQPELAMGAVVDGSTPIVVRNEDVIRMTGVSAAEFEATCRRELAEIERRRKRYLGDRAPLDVAGGTAIVVDDGIATGATTRAALRAVRARTPATLVLAVPVGPTDAHEDFDAIGLFYEEFRQVTDREVTQILARFATTPPGSATAH
jgi:putative phosphoribosyl transferase